MIEYTSQGHHCWTPRRSMTSSFVKNRLFFFRLSTPCRRTLSFLWFVLSHAKAWKRDRARKRERDQCKPSQLVTRTVDDRRTLPVVHLTDDRSSRSLPLSLSHSRSLVRFSLARVIRAVLEVALHSVVCNKKKLHTSLTFSLAALSPSLAHTHTCTSLPALSITIFAKMIARRHTQCPTAGH